MKRLIIIGTDGGIAMFKSVFAKYLLAFSIIILISFIMVAFIVGSMVRSYASDAKRDEIDWVADSTKVLLVTVYERNQMHNDFADFIDANKEQIRDMIDAVGLRDSNLTVFVTDETGRILITGSNAGIVAGALLPERVFSDIVTKGEYVGAGSLGGLLSGNHVTVGYAVSAKGAEVGSIFVCSSVVREQALINEMTETIIMASLWVMLAAMVALYFISDRIIGQLHSMTNAARQFAKGNFEQRLVVRGNDEISELCVAFNNMAESLDRLETMRNSFLANVSHDLRTPMTTISGFIDGINSGAIPQEKHSYYLGVISSEVHRLSRLVTELLDISKLESGDRKFVSEPFDICETARLILISFEQRIEGKRLEVSFDCENDSMIAIADKDAIHQVLYNLCENAIKFSREGGELRIGIRSVDRNKLCISVYNEGAGIPYEDQPYIFDRFYKSDKSRGLDKTGVGLGLYIVKTILEAQGETITLRSEPERFCEFNFTLKEGER